MKKILVFIAICFTFTAEAKSFVIPTYTDEIPSVYVNKVKKEKELNLKQNLPVHDTDKLIKVKVYSRERIALKHISKKIENDYILCQNYQINDEVTFYVAEDVRKNDKLLIKKDTKVIGKIREAQLGFGYFTSPDEIQISMFTTKDINNNSIQLYGTVLNEGKDTGLFQIILSGIPSLRASIPRNKVYTLYYK